MVCPSTKTSVSDHSTRNSTKTHDELGDPVHRRQVYDIPDDVEAAASNTVESIRVLLDEVLDLVSEPRSVCGDRVLCREQRLRERGLTLRVAVF